MAASRPIVAADVSPWIFSVPLRYLRYLLFKSLLQPPLAQIMHIHELTLAATWKSHSPQSSLLRSASICVHLQLLCSELIKI